MSNYKRIHNVSQNNHFSKSLNAMPEMSKMSVHPNHYTTMNAGDIVPIYCREVLPEEEIEISLDFVIRQTTLLTPTMGEMEVTFDAFFVPNRIVNQSWKAVEGENYSGSWTAPKVSLAPLKGNAEPGSVTQIPVGSVADYYGFPTQTSIPNALLQKCHDLKFRGYVMIYNEFYRDQNYQPPVPMSTLNIYQGFLDNRLSSPNFDGSSAPSSRLPADSPGDGGYGAGSVVNALIGGNDGLNTSIILPIASNPGRRFRAYDKPFKSNKLHDYFTSVLPTPQRSDSPVYASVSGVLSSVPLRAGSPEEFYNLGDTLMLGNFGTAPDAGTYNYVSTFNGTDAAGFVGVDIDPSSANSTLDVDSTNLYTKSTEVTGLAMSVDDIRMASAIQQVYETLARGGGRYREMTRAFFGVEVEDPYNDIPVRLGRFSRSLDLYQTAQTAASSEGSTPQGNLAAFGYTSSSGRLVKYKALEHGYIHIMAIVRHRNIYGSYFGRDNFRRNFLDFYMPQLANISEQGVKVAEINPFSNSFDDDFGYQEAWAEYRFEPDVVSGYMRPGISNSLSLWNYADDYDPELIIADGVWLKSNSEEVLNRTLAVTSENSPQFKCAFRFNVTKTLPMPTYSVPGMDII